MTVVAPPRTNVLALVGFVAAFVAPPAGIILGAVALRQIEARGESGRGIAIADLWIGIALTVLWLSLAALSVALYLLVPPGGVSATVP